MPMWGRDNLEQPMITPEILAKRTGLTSRKIRIILREEYGKRGKWKWQENEKELMEIMILLEDYLTHTPQHPTGYPRTGSKSPVREDRSPPHSPRVTRRSTSSTSSSRTDINGHPILSSGQKIGSSSNLQSSTKSSGTSSLRRKEDGRSPTITSGKRFTLPPEED